MIEQNYQTIALFETRSAALFVQTASKYASRILIKTGDRTANAKSIMGVISLSMEDGQSVTIIAEGEDEQQAVSALEPFFRTVTL